MSEFSLPGYEILEKVADGGMATIWKARQVSLDRIVAIKVLAPHFLADPEAMERFQREAQAAARLSHPGLIQVYDAGQAAGTVYYVMEYVPGRPLGEVLVKHGRFNEENTLALAECLAQALQYAWDRARVVHCDIKPDNIIVERDGTVRVADLGLARIMGQRAADDDDTVMGTPNYVSPEQARGEPDLDCRSDIYSLGATLYHLITGKLPFAGSPGSSAMDRHITDFLDDPVDVQPDVSPGMAALIEKMMVKDRDQRIASWADVLADLADVKEGRWPRGPRPAPGASTVRRSARRQEPVPEARSTSPGARKIVLSKKSLDGLRNKEQPAELPVVGALLTMLLWATLAAGIYVVISWQVPRGTAADFMKRKIEAAARTAAPQAARAEAAEPAPLEPSFEEPPSAEKTEAVVRWNDPTFVQGAKLYNAALEAYLQYQRTRKNPEVLKQIDAHCREAVRLFESCKGRAPAGFDLDGHISNAYHLLSDAQQSTHLGAGH
jgi:serine/threonine-protein kinase